MQSDTLEERYAIKLCFKLGKKATETYGMLQTAFGVVIYEALCFDVAQSQMNGAPNEIQTHLYTVDSLAC